MSHVMNLGGDARRRMYSPGEHYGPLDALTDRQDLIEMLRLHADEMGVMGTNGRGHRPASWRVLAPRLAGTLAHSSVVLWEGPIWQMATAGHEAFEGAIPSPVVRGAGNQFWVCADQTIVEGTDCDAFGLDRAPHVMNGVWLFDSVWNEADKSLEPLAVGDETGAGQVPGHAVFVVFSRLIELEERTDPDRVLPLFRMLPFIRQGVPIHAATTTTAAAVEFLNLRIAGTRAESIPRPTRRRIERDWGCEPEVKTVVLRKTESKPRPEGSEPVEWSCHWSVNFHWRKNHRDPDNPIPVSPYIKGDLDKPFKPPSRTIYRAQR